MNIERAHALGLDIGTSSVRAWMYDAAALPIEGLGHTVSYVPRTTPDGGVTIEAEELLHLVFSVLDHVSKQADQGGIRVTVVGVSCFWHSFLALDQRRQPLTPVILWADTRADEVATAMRDGIDSARLQRRTGAGLHASYWPARIVWLTRADPGLVARTRYFVSFAEYLYWRLFGRLAAGVSMASGTGLLNISRCAWDDFACSVAPGVRERLSPLDEAPGTDLRSEFRARWPALKDARWFPAAGDGACGNVGAGGWRQDRLVLTIGTSSAMRLVIRQPCDSRRQTIGGPAARGLWNYRLDREYGIVGGALSEGGNLMAWLETILRLPPLDVIEAKIAARPPDAARLTILPFIAGERSPDWIGRARAVIAGLHLGSEPVDILQAAIESVAYQLRTVFDQITQRYGTPRVVVAAGAALSRSPTWTQIVSNILERELVASQLQETSSRGAAALALAAAGILQIGSLDPLLGKTYSPAGSVDVYQAAARRQARLFERMYTMGREGT